MKTPDTVVPTTVEDLDRIATWFDFMSGYASVTDKDLSVTLAEIAHKIKQELK